MYNAFLFLLNSVTVEALVIPAPFLLTAAPLALALLLFLGLDAGVLAATGSALLHLHQLGVDLEDVRVQQIFATGFVGAVGALKGLLPCVDADVPLQVAALSECGAEAVGAGERTRGVSGALSVC